MKGSPASYIPDDQLVLLLTNEVRVSLIPILPIPRLKVLHDIRRGPQSVALIQLAAPELLLAAWLVRNQWCRLGMSFVDGVVLEIDFLLGGAVPVHMVLVLLVFLGLRSCHSDGSGVVVMWMVLVVDRSDSGFSSL